MISIRKPCHENWNEMSPNEKGRLCDKCCKVVVDFTKKTTSQIVEFLEARSSEKVCGRFRAEQVAVPVSSGKLPRTKVFLAALYFVFGGLLFSSCNTSHKPEIMGKVAVEQSYNNSFSAPDTAVKDSVVKKGKKGKVCPKPEEPERFLMGDVAWDPADTIK